MKIFLLDNYDSFTYNLVHYLEMRADVQVDVFRNNEASPKAAEGYNGIVLSPGPGLPSESGILMELIAEWKGKKPILGVCLGLQALAESEGAELVNMGRVRHGKAETMYISDHQGIFAGIPDKVAVGRYHSWTVDPSSLPTNLKITAKDDEGNVMAFSDNKQLIEAVQFHPESILTEYGVKMIGNWLRSVDTGAQYKVLSTEKP